MKIGDTINFGLEKMYGDNPNMTYIFESGSETNTIEKFFNFIDYMFDNLVEEGGVYKLSIYQNGALNDSGNMELLMKCEYNPLSSHIQMNLYPLESTLKTFSDDANEDLMRQVSIRRIKACPSFKDSFLQDSYINVENSKFDNVIYFKRTYQKVANSDVINVTYGTDASSDFTELSINTITRIA